MTLLVSTESEIRPPLCVTLTGFKVKCIDCVYSSACAEGTLKCYKEFQNMAVMLLQTLQLSFVYFEYFVVLLLLWMRLAGWFKTSTIFLNYATFRESLHRYVVICARLDESVLSKFILISVYLAFI